jgi:hypothetical protein
MRSFLERVLYRACDETQGVGPKAENLTVGLATGRQRGIVEAAEVPITSLSFRRRENSRVARIDLRGLEKS